MHAIITLISGFSRDERGTATISFVLWLPFIAAILMLVTDLTIIMFQHANADRVLQDANRLWAVGAITSSTQAEQYISSNLVRPDGSMMGTADSGIAMLTAISSVRVQLSDMDVFGAFRAIVGDLQITIRNQQAIERMES